MACVAMALPADAQVTSSSLRGRVTDQAGGAVADANVEVVHVPTGTTRNITTNANGRFSLRGLPVGGPYVVRLGDGTELKADKIEDLFLRLGQTESILLVAQRPGVQEIEEIVVTGQGVQTALKTGAVSNFGEEDLAKMPAISRDLKSIIQQDPKIAVDSTVDGGPGLSIAGGNIRFNSLTVDGIAQNDNFGLNKNGYPTRRAPISLDAIEALSVNIAPFDVTFGSFLGGNINVVTKSGTNEFHGGAFFFHSGDGIAGSTSKGEKLEVGEFKEQTYGATLGGPIIKDKLFFFASYEKFENTRPFPFRAGNANGVTEGNEIDGVTQADIDRAVQIAQDVFGFDALGFAAANPESDEKILLKLDWNITDSHRASATYQRSEGNVIRDFFTNPTTGNAALLSNRYNMTETLKTFSFQLFSDWTDNFSTEVKVGFKDVATDQVSIAPDFPAMTIFTAAGGTIRLGPDQFRHANDLDNDTRFIKVKGDYFLGDHVITAGFEQEKIDIFNLFVPWSKGEFLFGNLDDFENRSPFLTFFGNSFTGDPLDAAAEFSFKNNVFYIQDEWNPTDDLTVFAGLRYEVIDNKDKPAFNADFLARNGFSNEENLDGVDLFLPRFGFNYQVKERTTIRGGAGLFGGGTPNVWLANSYSNTGVLSTLKVGFFGPGEPEAVAATLAGSPNGGSAIANLQPFLSLNPLADTNGISPDFNTPSSWKFNLAVDHEFDLSAMGLGDGWNVTLEAIWTSVKDAVIWNEPRRQVVGTAPDGRPIYSIEAGFDLILENTSKGHGSVYSVDVHKTWFTDNAGIYDLSLGYSRQNIVEVNPGNAFIAFEGFGFPATTDKNAEILFNSEFEIKNRITANLSWQKEIFGDNTTLVNLFYSGRSGRHFSYTFGESFTFGGAFLTDIDFGGNFNSQSLYVPTGNNDPLIDTVDVNSAAALASLNEFIDGESCLAKHRGEAIPRHACKTGWINRLDFRFSQEVKLPGWDHGFEFIFDIENLTNLINNDWGRQESFLVPFNVPLVDVAINNSDQFVLSNFRTPGETVSVIPSIWKMQVGIRYRF